MECAEKLSQAIGDRSFEAFPTGPIGHHHHHHRHASPMVVEGALLERCVFFVRKVLVDADISVHQAHILCLLSHLAPSVVLRELTLALGSLEEGFKKHALVTLLARVMSGGGGGDGADGFMARLIGEPLPRHLTRAVSRLVVNLPSKVANALRLDVPDFFSVARYPAFVARACCAYVAAVADALRAGKDASLGLCGALIGGLGLHYPDAFDDVVPFLLGRPDDFVFRRVVQRLVVAALPADLQENAVVLICYRTPCYRQMDWLLEESITRDDNVKHVVVKKLLLGRYFSNDRVLKNVIGYLCSSPRRRQLAGEAVVELFHTWSDKVLMKHQTIEQQKYLTCALLTFVGFMRHTDFTLADDTVRQQCIQACLHGVQSHLSEPDPVLRNYGMIVGQEFLATVRSDIKSPDFPIDLAEREELLAFMQTPSESVADQPPANKEQEPQSQPKPSIDSDDDDEGDNDNDLVYQMDPQCKVPLYLRDCLRLVVPNNDGEHIEQAKICLEHLPALIVRYPEELRDTATDLCRFVLFAPECPRVFPEIGALKRESLVLLLIHATVPSSAYLIDQFYSIHLNHTQRLEILSAIMLASDRYANETTTTTMVETTADSAVQDSRSRPLKSSGIMRNIDQLTAKPRKLVEWSNDDFDLETETAGDERRREVVDRHWKDIVEERIAAKTRKIASKTVVSTQENRFGEVAGHLFYPLMRNFTDEVPLRIADNDSFLLVRLLETLGVIMSAARHTPRAYQMGRSLVQFASAFRYHDHEAVRRACSFAIASVLTAVPEELLEDETQLGLDMTELLPWLEVTAKLPTFDVQLPTASSGVELGPSPLSTRRIQELT